MDAKDIDSIIEDKVMAILDRELHKRNYVQSWVCIVDSVNGDGTVNVRRPNDTTVLTNKKNFTGVTLSAGNEVYLFSPYGISNSFVAIKK